VNFGPRGGAKFRAKWQGVAQADVGTYLWLPPRLFDAGAILFGDLASRSRRPRTLFAVAALMALSFAGLAYARSPGGAVAGFGRGLAGGGGGYPLRTSGVVWGMPANAGSLAGGMVAAAQSVVPIVVNPLIGHSIDVTGSYTTAILSIAAFIVPGCAVWLAMGRGQPASPG